MDETVTQGVAGLSIGTISSENQFGDSRENLNDLRRIQGISKTSRKIIIKKSNPLGFHKTYFYQTGSSHY